MTPPPPSSSVPSPPRSLCSADLGSVLALSLIGAGAASCATPTARQSAPIVDPFWTQAATPPPAGGDARLEWTIRNEVTSLGPLVGLAVVVDGGMAFRERWPASEPRKGRERSAVLPLRMGEHGLCVVALFAGTGELAGYNFVLRWAHTIDVAEKTTVRIRLHEQDRRAVHERPVFELSIRGADGTFRRAPARPAGARDASHCPPPTGKIVRSVD